MIRSRRLALAAAVVALGLTACGDPNTTTPVAEQPPVIHLAGSQSSGGGFAAAPAAATAEASTSADSKIAFMAPTEFVYDGEFPDLGSSGGSWFFDPNQQPDLDRIAALAASLGVEGDVRVVPAEQGGGWAVGPEDYSAAVLSVSADGMHSWYLSSAPVSSVGFACGAGEATVTGKVAPDAAPAVGAATTPADDPTLDPVAPDVPVTEPVALPECPTPTPPAGVPTKDEAIAKAKDLFTAWGYDVNAYQFDDIYADEFSANVNAYLTLDGLRAPIILSVGFGENGAVTFASGYLGVAQRGADYPTVGPAAGLERLKKQQDQFIGLGNSRAISATGQGVAEPAIAVPPCAPEAAAADGCNAVDNTQPVTVTLNSVKPDLTMIWDAGNTIWLLPAYTFGTADGGLYTVNAVDDAYLQQPDPAPATTEPVGDPGVVPTPEPAIEPPVAVSGTSPAQPITEPAPDAPPSTTP